MILAGDVGGTKCNLAVFPPGAGRRAAVASATLPSARYDSLTAVLDAFLETHPADVEAAAFGLPGPVVDGVCRTTNLPWIVRTSDVQGHLGTMRVRLLNDLAATVLGIPSLRADELETLQRGASGASGNIAVVAPGTGLGEAALVRDGDRALPLGSEGGHADFAPRDALEVDLWRWLREARGRAEYEDVLCGPGIVNLYRFLHRDEPHAPPWAPGKEGEPEAAALASRAALAGGCPLCAETLDRFVSILGAEAGNLALKVTATGGVYIGGGIAPKVLPALRGGRFTESFQAKGAFAEFLRAIPVHVILNPEAALLGALAAADEVAKSA